MYSMLSSSQPLIRTFWSFNLSNPFKEWLWFWYLSVLYKGESFSFIKGLWLLDLDNRKTILVEILGSPLHLVFFDGDWKIYCFLAFGYLLWDLYFVETLSCLQEGDFSLGVFARAPQLAWIGFACIKGFSLASLWSMISSCYFFVAFDLLSWRIKSDMVDVCCAGERVHWLPWANHFT